MTVEIRRYAVAAPVYRVEGWLAVEKLILGATQDVIVGHDRCLIPCLTNRDETLVYMCLVDEPYGIERSAGMLVADAAWHDEIAHDIASLSVPLAAQVLSLVDVTLSVFDHGLLRHALRERGVFFLRVRRPRVHGHRRD